MFGEVSQVSKIRRRVPVEDYLKPQKRFAHLFGKEPDLATLARLQGFGRSKHPALRASSTRCRHDDAKAFAITLDVGSSLANHTGSWRTERRSTAPPAAVQQRLPGRRRHPGLAVPRRVGRLRNAWRHLVRAQPLPRGHGAGLLSHLRDRVQSRQARFGRRHQLGRTIPRRRGHQARLEVPESRDESDKHVLVVGAGPSGLSAAYHLARLGHR
jgi:hypothetical protein